MSHKNLPSIEHVGQWDATVTLPLLQNVQVIHEDNKVLGATLVEDLGGAVVGAHIELCRGFGF